MNIKKGLTFNDVLLIPQYSEIVSRKNLDISTRLTNKIKLKIPIISSNMDTVTEDKMAIAMASAGGLGIIHRFLSVEDQVNMVKKVKRYINYKIKNPYIINDNSKISDYIQLVKEKGVKGFPVISHVDNKLVGIISNRDLLFSLEETFVSEIMTPLDKLIYSHEKTTMDEAFIILKENKIEKLPLVNENFEVTGLITIKDILHYKKINKVSTVDENGRLMVGAAIGVKPEDIDRAKALIEAKVDILCIDVAHGHNILAGNMVKEIKSRFPNIDVIAGNVATSKGVRYLIEAGADAIKIGIGNGSICTTRMVTGSGVPQITALIECVNEANKFNIPIISDGGNGGILGNIVKALATGSSSVMLGNFLAGTDESPGPILVKDNKKVKYIRGMAGYGANLSRKQRIDSSEDLSDVVPEGVDAYIPYKGPVKDILFQIIGGIKSGMSYCGSKTLKELPSKAEFIMITEASRKDSDYHGVNKI